jgi:lipopolysaccharide/colanic/teichoic acid biosynthesis glycosyltransferase/bifunctional N-acetylglucosamine-1-phosphate-uridyltransferase/glucosamine-1-phosphate-acetyltransferase GlmU-like protein
MTEFPLTAVMLANGATSLDDIPITPHPKFLLPIANHPLLAYQAALLSSAGVKEIIICVTLDGKEALQRAISGLGDDQIRVRCITRPPGRGTGGSLRDIEPHITGDHFWLMGPDLFLCTDLAAMLDFHKRANSLATVAAVRESAAAWRNERVECDAHGGVKNIHRIHPAQSRRSAIRPVGLYLFHRQVLANIPRHGHYDLKEQLFSDLSRNRTPATVWEVKDYCRSISSIDSYMGANRDVLLKRREFPLLEKPGDITNPDSMIITDDAPRTLVKPFSIGQGVEIGKGVALFGPLAIGRNCTIGDHALLNGCLLFPNVRIGAHSRLVNCIVAENASVEDGVEIRDRVILPEPSTLHAPALGLLPMGESEAGESGRVNHIRNSARRGYLIWKRAFDVVFSLAMLIFLSPIMLLIACAIGLDSPGNIIFRQRRCGLNGVEFTMYKFRTMVKNAEAAKREIQHLNEVDGPMFKITSDPRVTRVGKYLRATNLDEVPQFLNILLGDMALVGPRPLSWDEMRYNPRWRDLRITVSPGLIGLWQLKSHEKTSFEDWIHNDLQYIRERSAWLDLKLLLLAIVHAAQSFARAFGKPATKKYEEGW